MFVSAVMPAVHGHALSKESLYVEWFQLKLGPTEEREGRHAEVWPAALVNPGQMTGKNKEINNGEVFFKYN